VNIFKGYRSWMKPRGVGGWVWWLSILWVAIGAASSAFVFFSSTQPVTASSANVPTWVGWLALLALVSWLVLTIPVLIAGVAQLRDRELRAIAWTGAWVVDLTLTVLIKAWQDNPPQKITCDANGCGVVPYYGPAVVDLRELGICAAFLTLGAVMTWILARPAERRRSHAACA
jgi:hypothetical protein